MTNRTPLGRIAVVFLVVLVGWPWQIALPAVESTWTVFRTPMSKRLDKLADRSSLSQSPAGSNRRQCGEIIADEADDELEWAAPSGAVAGPPPPAVFLALGTTASSPSTPRMDVRPAPRFSLRC